MDNESSESETFDNADRLVDNPQLDPGALSKEPDNLEQARDFLKMCVLSSVTFTTDIRDYLAVKYPPIGDTQRRLPKDAKPYAAESAELLTKVEAFRKRIANLQDHTTDYRQLLQEIEDFQADFVKRYAAANEKVRQARLQAKRKTELFPSRE